MNERATIQAGDAYGTHRALEPKGALPQPALRVDNDFSRLFRGEVLLSVETLNIDAASFTQMEQQGDPMAIVLRTVAERGKQHNPVTGSGGMLLGRVVQVAEGRPAESGPGAPGEALAPGDKVATLVSLSLTPLRIDRVRAVRPASAQMDVDGEAVLFGSGAYARLPPDLPERLALAVLDVAGAAPQVARLVKPGVVVTVLGAGGKSGILCVAEARRRVEAGGGASASEGGKGGASAFIVGLEANPRAAEELRALGLCDAVVAADARDPVAVRDAVLKATGGRESDVTFSCVNVPDAELGAILATRDRGIVYFFAMSTSFTKAALGAEGVGKDVDLLIGNGYAHGHAEHSLAMMREMPAIRALFEKRYG
jgi:L-erythro-3,5-diaminohexanoate dehydrogenase